MIKRHKMHLPSKRHTVDPLTGNVVELFEDYDPPIEDEDGQLAYLRHLENRGWEEAEGERQWEAERGVESFADAYARSMGYLDAQDRELKELA